VPLLKIRRTVPLVNRFRDVIRLCRPITWAPRERHCEPVHKGQGGHSVQQHEYHQSVRRERNGRLSVEVKMLRLIPIISGIVKITIIGAQWQELQNPTFANTGMIIK